MRSGLVSPRPVVEKVPALGWCLRAPLALQASPADSEASGKGPLPDINWLANAYAKVVYDTARDARLESRGQGGMDVVAAPPHNSPSLAEYENQSRPINRPGMFITDAVSIRFLSITSRRIAYTVSGSPSRVSTPPTPRAVMAATNQASAYAPPKRCPM